MKRLYVLFGLFALALAACAPPATEHTLRGNRAYAAGNPEAALQDYQAAQVNQPDSPRAYFNAGVAFLINEEPDRAITAFQQALRFAEGQLAVDAYYNLGNTYMQLERADQAVNAYREALRINPDDDDARHNLEIAQLLSFRPTPTAIEQQIEPQQGQSDPTATPTDQPGGFDGPTPSPPPLDVDLSATPSAGESPGSGDDARTPVPQEQGEMTVEDAQRLLDRVQENQRALREFRTEPATEGDINEKDW